MTDVYKEEMIALCVLPNGALHILFPVKKTYALIDPDTTIESLETVLRKDVDARVLEHLKRKWPEILKRIWGRGPIVFVGTQGVVKDKGKFRVIG